jgi:hypothetical protein
MYAEKRSQHTFQIIMENLGEKYDMVSKSIRYSGQRFWR